MRAVLCLSPIESDSAFCSACVVWRPSVLSRLSSMVWSLGPTMERCIDLKIEMRRQMRAATASSWHRGSPERWNASDRCSPTPRAFHLRPPESGRELSLTRPVRKALIKLSLWRPLTPTSKLVKGEQAIDLRALAGARGTEGRRGHRAARTTKAAEEERRSEGRALVGLLVCLLLLASRTLTHAPSPPTPCRSCRSCCLSRRLLAPVA